MKMSEKIEEQVAEYFAKEHAFSFHALDNLLDLFDSLRDFSHHLSENHYYSEVINKKVMAINLDLHLLSLQLPLLETEGKTLNTEVTVAILAGKKPSLNKAIFEAFKKKFSENKTRVIELNESLQVLVKEIKVEYGSKS